MESQHLSNLGLVIHLLSLRLKDSHQFVRKRRAFFALSPLKDVESLPSRSAFSIRAAAPFLTPKDSFMSPTIRFAQFNASLNRNADGQLVNDLSNPAIPDNRGFGANANQTLRIQQAKNVAEIIQRTNADVLLINEFDYFEADPTKAVELFQQNFLSISQNGATPVEYPYFYIAPSNTGIPTGFDLNNNGLAVTQISNGIGAPGYGDDAFGFGTFPGQFGMVLLSKYPIDTANVRTFQTFLWKDMPGNLLTNDPTVDNPATPVNENLGGFYSPEKQAILRLSSKSHWDVPIQVDGEVVHALVSHPTPPVFDGPEDRNGKRNHDEIRFWADYVTPGQGDYIYDDNGGAGGLTSGSRFVIMGDQNADPRDGDSYKNAIWQLLLNPNINTNAIPSSLGGIQQAALQGGANLNHKGNPAFDTADFADTTPGNLRADYVLPSADLPIVRSQVFWGLNTDPLFPLVGTFNPTLPGGYPSSDHRPVLVDVHLGPTPAGRTLTEATFLSQTTFPTGFVPAGPVGTVNGVTTPLGGLSGVVYDASQNLYYSISDDRSEVGPARFYTFTADLQNLSSSVSFTSAVTLKDPSGNTFPRLSLDPEDIVLTPNGTLLISSEGEVRPDLGPSRVTNPFIKEFDRVTGQEIRSLPIPAKFLPQIEDTNGNGVVDAGDRAIAGVRNNLAFESLTLTPNQKTLFTATENALIQDGPAAGVSNSSPARIIQYNLVNGQPEKEYLYEVDPVAFPPNPANAFATNGLVDLLALDDRGTMLALERSFAVGAVGTPGNTGNTIKIYEISTQGATDISFIDSLNALDPAARAAIQPVQKRLLLNLDALNLPTGTDNIEGLAFGPKLPDGRQSIVLVSDNNFNPTQFTQILALDLEQLPSVTPRVETRPALLDDEVEQADADDPAIYLHPTDSSKSLVVTAVKDGGLRVYDLGGNLVQEINPGRIRYNNVDLLYGFELGGETMDLAIATDRRNDKIAIFAINPDASRGSYLTDITDPNLGTLFQMAPFEPPYSASSRSAYGLATYRSPVTHDAFVFVNRRQTGDVVQLELFDLGNGTIGVEPVRNFTVPLPAGAPTRTNPQLEGMVVDQETGFLYIGQENVGIWKYQAEPNGGSTGRLIDRVKAIGGSNLTDDVEGLTIYYGADGTGYLLASSQGDNTFAVYSREGNNDFLGRFAVGPNGSIDGVQGSDGADVLNVPLGPNFPYGLFVTQDGDNLPRVLVEDDGELENISTNFKFVPWENIATAFANPLNIDTSSYNPRTPQPQSITAIASGDVTQTTAVLLAQSNFVGNIEIAYSTDPNFEADENEVEARVTVAGLPVKVPIRNLQPNTTYYYRVTDAAGAIEMGRFTTAAALGTFAGLSFGATGDWRGELAPYPGIANATDFNLNFFIELGDTIYADFPSNAVRNPDGSRKVQATTLDDFRAKHAEVYGDRFGVNTWKDLRAATAILATIDDHEVTNDFEGGKDLSRATAAEQAFYGASRGFINDSPLYETGMQVFQEYNPLRDEFYGNTGDPRTTGERKLYRYSTYGSDAATFILDARSFRDEGLPAVTNLANPLQVGTFLTQSFDPSRTLLGRVQLEDLKQDLLNAESNGVTWKFIVVPEPIQNLGVLAASDRFEGYAAERTEILKFIDENRIQNVVFIAADIHGTLVNNLTYQTSPFGPQIATSAFEITTGSLAFDAPFGPTVAELAVAAGLLTPAQKAFYDSLPVANDADSLPNDKDDFIKQIIDNALQPLGYDPIGLNHNLAIAEGKIDATLLQGDYIATHTYGWTKFDIDPTTQKLRVTTYGIAPYSEAELLADPAAIINRTPGIVSQFEVNAKLAEIRGTRRNDTLFGTSASETFFGLGGNDTIYAGEGNNTVWTLDGNDTIYAGAGNDFISAGNGNNTIYAGEGINRILAGAGRDLIYSGAGSDFIDAGNGNNTIYAGEGSNIITAGAGNDLIYAGAGNDVISAGAGRNTIYAGGGNNRITSIGKDTIHVGSGQNTFVLGKGEGDATIIGFGAEDRISLSGGLKYEDLTIRRIGGDTRLSAGGDLIATLKWVQPQQVTASLFV